MLNSEFRLLAESMGFYSAKTIVRFLRGDVRFSNLTERPVDYWLKGRADNYYIIPDDVVRMFVELSNFQEKLIECINKKDVFYEFVYKDEMLMWENHPELKFLPTTFLNQTIIRANSWKKVEYFAGEINNLSRQK